MRDRGRVGLVPTPRDEGDHMKHKSFYAVVLFALCMLQVGWTAVQAVPSERSLEVKVNYTGSGIVDAKHKIYVMLFDANPMTATTLVDSTSGPTPAVSSGVSHILARQSTDSRNGKITFSNLTAPKVYAAAFFDKTGQYHGVADPSPGSPMGLYGTFPDQLTAITTENAKTVRVTISFDDSHSTP